MTDELWGLDVVGDGCVAESVVRTGGGGDLDVVGASVESVVGFGVFSFFCFPEKRNKYFQCRSR